MFSQYYHATNITSAPVTSTITVTPSANSCVGAATVVTAITVNPTPVVNTIANQILCNGSSIAAINFASPVAGSSYSWTNDVPSMGLAASGSGSIASFAAINITSAPVLATIRVTPSANGCVGAATLVTTILVNPTPVVNTTANQILCNGSATAAINFSSAVSGSSYAWTNTLASIGLATSGSGNIGSFAATNITSAPVTSTITVTPSANSCVGAATLVTTILVNPTPLLSSMESGMAICDSLSFNYTPSSLTTGVVFNWSRAAVTGIEQGASSGTGNISEVLSNSTNTNITVTYVFTLTANGCSHTQSITIIVHPTPFLSFLYKPFLITESPYFII